MKKRNHTEHVHLNQMERSNNYRKSKKKEKEFSSNKNKFKKPKYQDNNSEKEHINPDLLEIQKDSELFFFDIAGNKTDSHRQKLLRDTDMYHKKKKKTGKKDKTVPEKDYLLHSESMEPNVTSEPEYNDKTQNTLNINSPSQRKLDKLVKKVDNISDVCMDIRESDCEIFSYNKAKRKKKTRIIPNNSEQNIDSLVDIQKNKKKKLLNTVTQKQSAQKEMLVENNLNKKKKRKRKGDILVDITDSDCEMTAFKVRSPISSKKAKKDGKKSTSLLVDSDITQNKLDTFENTDLFNNTTVPFCKKKKKKNHSENCFAENSSGTFEQPERMHKDKVPVDEGNAANISSFKRKKKHKSNSSINLTTNQSVEENKCLENDNDMFSENIDKSSSFTGRTKEKKRKRKDSGQVEIYADNYKQDVNTNSLLETNSKETSLIISNETFDSHMEYNKVKKSKKKKLDKQNTTLGVEHVFDKNEGLNKVDPPPKKKKKKAHFENESTGETNDNFKNIDIELILKNELHENNEMDSVKPHSRRKQNEDLKNNSLHENSNEWQNTTNEDRTQESFLEDSSDIFNSLHTELIIKDEIYEDDECENEIEKGDENVENAKTHSKRKKKKGELKIHETDISPSNSSETRTRNKNKLKDVLDEHSEVACQINSNDKKKKKSKSQHDDALLNLPSGIPLPEEIVIPGDLPENENNLLNIGVKSEPQDDEYIFKGPAAVSTENEHHSNSRKKNKNKLQHEDNLPCVPKEMSVLETVSFGVDFFENSKGKLLLEDSMLINKWLDNLDNTESTNNCKIDENSRYFNNAGECGVLDPTGVNFNNDSVEKHSLSKDTYPSSSEGYKSDSSELRDKPNRKKTNEDQLINERDCDNVEVVYVKETNALEKLEPEDVSTENSLEINHNKVVEDSGLCEKEEHQKSENVLSEKNDPQTKIKSTKKQNVVTSDSSDEDRVEENTDDPQIKEDREKLNQIPIMVKFQVCPLHSILTRASIPTAAQKAEIKKLKLEVKTGPFNKVENEIIMENWRKFCEEYGFSGNPEAFVNFSRKLHQEQITGFLRYLGRGLENRMLHLIHARFKIMVQKSKTKCGRFSTEEDRKILEYLSKSRSRHPFSDLAKILKRTKCSIAKRYEKLKEYRSTSKARVDWTPELTGKFLKRLKRITKCDIGSLQHRPITLDEWKKLSEKMAPISIKKLRFAWENTIYPRLYATEGVNLRKIKKKIIKMLIKRKETDWRALNWKEIAKKIPGFTPLKVYMLFKQTVIFHVPPEKQANLKDSLDYLNDALLKYDLIPTTHKFTKIKHKDKV